MGTTSSAQRGSKCAGDAVAEESNGANEMPADGNIDDKLLQKNGQISSLHEKTEGQVDELNGHCEEQVNTEVGSSFVSLKEDNIESLQGDGEPLVKAENEKEQAVSTPDITLKEENEGDEKMDDINEVGFKKIFRFVGLKFTLKKDKYEKPELKETSTSEKEEGVVSTTEESKDTQEESVVDTDEQNTEKKTSDEPVCGDASLRSDAADLSPKEDIEIIVDQVSEITEPNKEATSDKGLAEEVSTSPQVEEAMSPIKRFFTQGIFASLKKKKRSTEEELSKEKSREDVKTIDKEGGEKASEEGAKDVNNPCVCLETTILQEGTDSPAMKEGDGHKTAMEGQSRPECELLSSQERAKVQGSPLKRLFRKLSTRRQRESKAAETKVTEAEQPQETKELGECLKVDEPKPSEGEQVTDAAQDEPKKRSDSSVSWEALICGGSGKKRARKTSDSEDETANKEGLVPEKPKESSPGSSLEGDYDNLTSSNEQPGSPLEGDGGSTWKSLKKLVTPKRKVRAGVNASTEEIPSDNETSKDESSFSIKKIIPEHKKRKSDEARDETSSDEAVKGVGSEDEDDQTPAVVPLSEYETNEPENRREELTLEIPLDISKEKEIIEEKGYLSMSEEAKPIENLGLETSKAPCDAAPSVPPRATEDFEEFTEFISKHQQLSDIPEEGVLEESAVTLVSSAEGNQDDTLAEDVVELTSDAVTAPEHVEEESLGDETTEMVSAVSQLTESPKTSGNATPVPAEYVERETESILRESLETICMASGFQSVTTKDEVADTTAVLLSRHILHSVITGERKVLVAHDKTDATAICTGLVSQEIRGVEEIHHLPMVEGISEVTESIPTELVSADVVEESEAVRVSAGEVFTTEVKEIKIDHQETVSPLIETEQQAVPELEKVKEEKEEVNGLQKSMPVHVAITNAVPGVANFFKEQVVSEDTHLPEIEGPLKPATKEPVCGQPAVITEVTVEGGNVHALPNVELLTADVEHAAPAKVVEHVAHDITASIPDTPTEKSLEKSEESIAVVASAVDHPELKETVGIIRPVSDSVTSEAVESVTEAPMGKVSSVHFVEDHEIQVAVKNESQTAGIIVEGVLEVAAGDDSVTVEHPEFKETVSIVRPFSDSVTLEAAETVMEVLTEKLPSESFNDQQVKDESQTATTTSDTVPDVALAEEAVIMEYPEIKETVSTVRAVSDSVTMEAVGPVREVLLEKAPSVHDQEVQDKSQTTAAIVEPLPEVASAHDSTIVVDVCKKEEEIAEEVLVQQGTKTETAKESSKVSEADKVEPEPEVIEPCKEKETSVPEASLDATDISDVKMAGEEQETATKMMTDLSDAAEDVTVPDTHVEQNRTEYVKESVDGGVGTEKDSDLSQVPGSYEQTQGQVAKKEAEALITTECSTEQENQVSETCTGINIQEYVAETIKEEEASTITQEIERPSAVTEVAVVTPVATEKVETVNVELTGRSKQDAEILETVSGELKEETHVSAADTAEHLTEMEEDVWEDAVDDINFKVDAQGQANQDEKELNINQELDLEFQDAADKNIESCTKNTTC
ncbi:A-kinase anchor protein 12 [Chanos chanos]|uniref:A-kinase anchor protein 12 n=1 Tax=Chanos chanos TaxID=29144 RepID=A0A6J2WG42_CHACN|nr:A-kinase anchor protein 12-like [Chanos chanos]